MYIIIEVILMNKVLLIQCIALILEIFKKIKIKYLKKITSKK
jgi:hypothetical protein